jgi:hypothetical protein
MLVLPVYPLSRLVQSTPSNRLRSRLHRISDRTNGRRHLNQQKSKKMINMELLSLLSKSSSQDQTQRYRINGLPFSRFLMPLFLFLFHSFFSSSVLMLKRYNSRNSENLFSIFVVCNDVGLLTIL